MFICLQDIADKHPFVLPTVHASYTQGPRGVKQIAAEYMKHKGRGCRVARSQPAVGRTMARRDQRGDAAGRTLDVPHGQGARRGHAHRRASHEYPLRTRNVSGRGGGNPAGAPPPGPRPTALPFRAVESIYPSGRAPSLPCTEPRWCVTSPRGRAYTTGGAARNNVV